MKFSRDILLLRKKRRRRRRLRMTMRLLRKILQHLFLLQRVPLMEQAHGRLVSVGPGFLAAI